jgi:ubiquitin C-terminal hydrolase
MESKGLSGLTDLGNTCYLNACLQVLSHTPGLHQATTKEDLKTYTLDVDTPENSLLNEWNNLRDLLWDNNCTIGPNKLVNEVHSFAKYKDNPLFSGYLQNDLPEFLLMLVDGFHEALKHKVQINITGKATNDLDKMAIKCYKMVQDTYKNGHSSIIDLFYGIQITKIITLKGVVLSTIPEPMFILDLPIVGNGVMDCLDQYYGMERLDGDNQYMNDSTHLKEDVDKCTVVWILPNILVISLKRFNNTGNKNNHLISFDLNHLDMSKYVEGYYPQSYIYEVYAICNHMGNNHHGHYNTYIKHSNGKWYCFDNSNISLVCNVNLYVNAYCIFYKKKNM